MDSNYDPPSASMNPKGFVAVTPIKHFLLVGLDIYTVDWADKRELQCRATSAESAHWVIESLAKWHGKSWMHEESETQTVPSGAMLEVRYVDKLTDE